MLAFGLYSIRDLFLRDNQQAANNNTIELQDLDNPEE